MKRGIRFGIYGARQKLEYLFGGHYTVLYLVELFRQVTHKG